MFRLSYSNYDENNRHDFETDDNLIWEEGNEICNVIHFLCETLNF